MKDFLKKIVSFIIDNPEDLQIKEETVNQLKIYTIVVPQEEIGRIIGKEGKVISAIRCLARLKNLKNQERFFIKVAESQIEKGFSLPMTTGASGEAS